MGEGRAVTATLFRAARAAALSVALAGSVAGGAFAQAAAPATPAAPAPSGTAATPPATNADGPQQCDYNNILHGLESGGVQKPYTADNGLGYVGKYQMGRAALNSVGYMKGGAWTGKNGINSIADWKANGPVQEQAQQEWIAYQSKEGTRLGLDKYIGQTFNGCAVTKNGITAASHLVGPGGAQSFFQSGGKCGTAAEIGQKNNSSDRGGRGTCASKYVCAMATCGATQQPDMSKQTCSVVMPMIESISCSNYTGALRTFCQQTQPHLMTRQECSSAEAMAQAAPKGPNKEKCEHLTFAQGTGSWSFALACSYASDAVADGDGATNPGGPVSDPACIEKLKGMGVQFDTIGQKANGSSAGKTCTIENAVAYSGLAVPFGAKLTMTCDMAVAMEQFGQKMAARGTTSYYGIGSIRPCGPMIDNRGPRKGTVTEHAFGRAVDISGFVVAGKKISFGAIHKPTTPEGSLALAAKQDACSTFRGVLSPTYDKYEGTFVHFHVEWSTLQACR